MCKVENGDMERWSLGDMLKDCQRVRYRGMEDEILAVDVQM